ncbi:MAG: cell division protein ZapA, partial [Variovorax sp.]
GKVKARDRIAVLASLNLAFDLVQSEAAPVATPAPVAEPAAAAVSSDSDANDPRLSQLLHRLDSALAGDGHLL